MTRLHIWEDDRQCHVSTTGGWLYLFQDVSCYHCRESADFTQSRSTQQFPMKYESPRSAGSSRKCSTKALLLFDHLANHYGVYSLEHSGICEERIIVYLSRFLFPHNRGLTSMILCANQRKRAHIISASLSRAPWKDIRSRLLRQHHHQSPSLCISTTVVCRACSCTMVSEPGRSFNLWASRRLSCFKHSSHQHKHSQTYISADPSEKSSLLATLSLLYSITTIAIQHLPRRLRN